jgi:hypothetical protein
LEHALTEISQVAKGKNFLQRGEAFSNITGEWFLENDFSKFEASQRIRLLELIELGVWKRLSTDSDYAKLKRLFYAKLEKNGHTLNGLKFKFRGCRGSGDMDTGLFNTIINIVAIEYFLEENNLEENIEKYMVDGDDSVTKIPRGTKLSDLKNTFNDFGFDTKLVVRKDYHDVEFCSSKFIQINPGTYYQVQNLEKLLSNVGYLINPNFTHCADDYYASLGYMYMVVYKDIPLYYDLGKYLRSCRDKHYIKTELVNGSFGAFNAFEKTKELNIHVDPVLAYTEIMMSTGLSPPEISYLQQQFSKPLVIPSQYCGDYKQTSLRVELKYQVIDPYTLIK